jgi:N-ethylmaleimide reductase
METINNLFSPLQIGDIAVSNRIFMGPAGRARVGEGNRPHPLAITYYTQRAGAGLIITEAVPITASGSGTPFSPGIYSADQVTEWKKITDAVHEKGSSMVLQLWHAGRASLPEYFDGTTLPVAPSAIGFDLKSMFWDGQLVAPPTPRALNLQEIPAIIDLYVNAARNAELAGFDGVEIHAGNGYLLEQFLHETSNQRTDQYGGSVENRARLVLEVLDAVIKVAGKDRVGIRISPNNRLFGTGDLNPAETYSYLAAEINKRQPAYLHLLEPFGDGDPVVPFPKDGQKVLPLVRSLFDGVLLLNGALNRDSAEQLLTDGLADAFVFSRLFMSNPDLVSRLQHDLPLNELNMAFIYEGEDKGYTDYPFAAIESGSNRSISNEDITAAI